ncbi:MAG TPA: DegT/DnrJ/EryC1/StrS family aminotransferase [Gemmatimonadales bacterium]|nr:DegT/DnrJ/EryC1/StrS family aminotransferase [Gemmatimonadales bacterium]
MPFSPPAIGDDEIAEVVDSLRSGWITTGPKTRQFEAAFAQRVGAADAIGLSSCTAALHTALVALGTGPGDEVITTPLTFCSCVNVIEQVGAHPVLADVTRDTLNIDPDAIAAAITPRTRAILVVHYAGHPADLGSIRAIAAQHRLALIEDAAHAFPAAFQGQPIGAGPNPVAFSFYATKNLTTGEGGMLTGEPGLIERARVLSLHGMNRDAWRRYDVGGSWFYEVVEPGFKYNMTDIQAALGLAQLRRLDALQQRRRRVAEAYTAAFGGHDAFETPVQHPDVEHAWHLYPLRLRLDALCIDRARFIAELTRRRIQASVHFIPIHLHPWYRDRYGCAPLDYPVAFENYRRLISLPLNAVMTDGDAAAVIEAVLDIAEIFAR